MGLAVKRELKAYGRQIRAEIDLTVVQADGARLGVRLGRRLSLSEPGRAGLVMPERTAERTLIALLAPRDVGNMQRAAVELPNSAVTVLIKSN